jgi:major membrane immunogen (membrane-anchored lipoprotein)
MKVINNLFLAVIVSLFVLSACSKSDDNKGPMEKAGQAVDKAMDQAKEKTGQAMEKAGEGMKEAGQKMRDSAGKSE